MPHALPLVGMAVPIIPILLLPFILIFFVIVFPIWGVALIILGSVLLVVRGLNALATKMGTTALASAERGVYHAFRWVWTFAGFAGKITGAAEQAVQPPAPAPPQQPQQHRP